MTDLTKARQLLAQALRDPFPQKGQANHVKKWAEFLVENWPLWSFQIGYYRELEGDGWFSTDALKKIVFTLQSDDGVHRKTLTPLETELDYRRYRIATARAPSAWNPPWPTAGDELKAGPSLFSRLRFPGLRADTYIDADGEEVEISPYENVGYEFMQHVENLRNTAKRDRGSIERQILKFAKSLAKQGKLGRRREAPSTPLLKALVKEGRELVDVCWPLMRAKWPLDAQRFAPLDLTALEVRSWSARLALPLMSRREIAVMCTEIRRAATWPKQKSGKPTPRLFALWIVSRRLKLSAKAVARQTLGSAAAELFTSHNPIGHV